MENQQRKDRLVSRLYYISAGMLALFSIHLLIVLGFDILRKSPDAYFSYLPNHVTGYSMPVDIEVRTFDTILKYNRKANGTQSSQSGEIFIQNGKSVHDKTEIRSILNDPAYDKTIIRQVKQVHSDRDYNVDLGEVLLLPARASGSVLIQPKNTWLTVLLGVRNYAAGACILFILFQLTRLFRRLKNNFSFNSSLSDTIWLIGNSLLLYQLLLFTTGTLVSFHVESITYIEKLAGVYDDKEAVRLFISHGVNLITVFAGLALVTLSKLLNYGYELQQENDLTI